MRPGDLVRGDVFGNYMYRALGAEEVSKTLVVVGTLKKNELAVVVALGNSWRGWALVLSQRGCLGWTRMDALERT